MSAPKPVVYIVEDDPSFRKSMERLIRMSGYETVAFESANAFLKESSIKRPACLLLDVQLPDIDGLHLQQELSETGYKLPIIFMTGHGTIQMSVHAMKKGAIDFLPKPFKTQDLLSAIVKAVKRDTQNVQEESLRNEVNLLIDSLTPREKEVLRWVITGKLNKQIAWELGTTEKTIKVHRSRVMQKTRCSSVAELVRFAEQANISPAE